MQTVSPRSLDKYVHRSNNSNIDAQKYISSSSNSSNSSSSSSNSNNGDDITKTHTEASSDYQRPVALKTVHKEVGVKGLKRVKELKELKGVKGVKGVKGRRSQLDGTDGRSLTAASPTTALSISLNLPSAIFLPSSAHTRAETVSHTRAETVSHTRAETVSPSLSTTTTTTAAASSTTTSTAATITAAAMAAAAAAAPETAAEAMATPPNLSRAVLPRGLNTPHPKALSSTELSSADLSSREPSFFAVSISDFKAKLDDWFPTSTSLSSYSHTSENPGSVASIRGVGQRGGNAIEQVSPEEKIQLRLSDKYGLTPESTEMEIAGAWKRAVASERGAVL